MLDPLSQGAGLSHLLRLAFINLYVAILFSAMNGLSSAELNNAQSNASLSITELASLREPLALEHQ